MATLLGDNGEVIVEVMVYSQLSWHMCQVFVILNELMAKPVTMYTTKTCGFCKAEKEFFAEHDVEYTEIDVGADQDKAREMIEKSGQMGVPVTVVGEGDDEELIVGFDKQRLAAALGIDA